MIVEGLKLLENPNALLTAIYLYFGWQLWSILAPSVRSMLQMGVRSFQQRFVCSITIHNPEILHDVLKYFYEHFNEIIPCEKVAGGWCLAPGSHIITFNGKWVHIVHTVQHATNGSNVMNRTLTLSTITRDKSFLQDWLTKVLAKKTELSLHLGSGNWWAPAKFHRRSLDTVIIQDRLKEEIIADMANFRERESRYLQLQIPYRRSYLLSSVPGMGKTSLITAIATHFELGLYSLSFSNTMTDTVLAGMVRGMKRDSILVIEDIDCIFQNRTPMDTVSADSYVLPAGTTMTAGTAAMFQSIGDPSTPKAPVSKVTLSGLLNILDGIGTPHGLIVIMTTNYPERLDSALIREERVHKHWKLEMHTELIEKMFLRFYPDKEPMAKEFSKHVTTDVNMAKLQGYFVSHLDRPQEAIQHAAQFFTNKKED